MKLPKKYQALLRIKRPVLIECDDRFRILYPSGLSLYRNHVFMREALELSHIRDSNELDFKNKILNISCFVSDYMYNENDRFRFNINSKRNDKELHETVEAMFKYDKEYNVKVLAVIDT